MRYRLTLAIMPLLAAMLLTGCGGAQQTADTAPVDPDQIQYVQIIEQETGSDASLAEAMVIMIDSEQERDSLNVDIPLAQQVDFDQQSLIVLAMGEQNTGGYWARITGVQRVGDELWVQGVVNQPGPDAATTQQITHPYAAIIIPTPDEDVQLRRQIDTVTGRTPDEFAANPDTDTPPAE